MYRDVIAVHRDNFHLGTYIVVAVASVGFRFSAILPQHTLKIACRVTV